MPQRRQELVAGGEGRIGCLAFEGEEGGGMAGVHIGARDQPRPVAVLGAHDSHIWGRMFELTCGYDLN